jgi:hypothetical protein
MDPQQTWNDLLTALRCKHWEEAKELADSLHEWIRKRGFPPVTIGEETLGNEWHRTIASFVCLVVANKVDDIQKRREKRKKNTKLKGSD